MESLINNATPIGDMLYFSSGELWKTDGTEAGTVLVKDINTGRAISNPGGLTAVGDTLYFNAFGPPSYYVNAIGFKTGRELWKSDGTEAGTVLVKDINTGSGSSNPGGLTAVGDTLYFSANDGTNGYELWKSDGTEAGTVLVKDINPGSDDSDLRSLTAVGDTLYFTANNGINGSELWKSDGTEEGTVLIQDINPGSGSSNPGGLTAVGDTLYFTADDGINGDELWALDTSNQPPTDISLSATSFDENIAAESVVASFNTTDPDSGDTFSYSLIDGVGASDNALFTINSDQLEINESPDFESKNSYDIRVQTTDAAGLAYEKPFTLEVNDIVKQVDPITGTLGTPKRIKLKNRGKVKLALIGSEDIDVNEVSLDSLIFGG